MPKILIHLILMLLAIPLLNRVILQDKGSIINYIGQNVLLSFITYCFIQIIIGLLGLML